MRLTPLLAAALTATAALVVVGGHRATAASGCLNTTIKGTYEEQYVDQPQPQTIISQGGFAGLPRSFAYNLCAAKTLAAVRAVVDSSSSVLWSYAVEVAQGKVKAGTLPAGDDRPLYWTRLEFTRDLRRYSPHFALSAAARAALIADVDSISRGQRDISFTAKGISKKVIVTGFDPFELNDDINNGNPAGAAALSLDGKVFKTPKGLVEFQAFLMPVRWDDFAAGDFEKVMTPILKQVDMFTTISQGRPGRFDLEVTNGDYRGGFPDNNNECYLGTIPIAPGTKTITPQPQWTTTTLPVNAMAKAKGLYHINIDTDVTTLPAPVPPLPTISGCTANLAYSVIGGGITHKGPPLPFETARGGGGGNYLSNEIAYRATLLRDALGLTKLPGGHLHTPVLVDPAEGSTQVTNPDFAYSLETIVAETQKILLAGVAAL